jgi:hypothetical protein
MTTEEPDSGRPTEVDLTDENSTAPKREPPQPDIRTTTELAGTVDPQGTGVEEPSLRIIGRSLTKWIIALMVLMLIMISIYSVLTYPRIDSIAKFADKGKQLDAYREYQATWFGQVKDLLQWSLSLLGALLSTIIGYIFGREASAHG